MTAAGRSRSHLLIVVLALSGLLLLTLVLAPMLLTTFTLPFGGLGIGADCAEAAADREDVSRSARDDIPEAYLRLYKEHGARVGVQRSVPAAIGKRGTAHARSTLPGLRSGTKDAVAADPMQFLISTRGGKPRIDVRTKTVNGYASDGDGDGIADVYNPADAILG